MPKLCTVIVLCILCTKCGAQGKGSQTTEGNSIQPAKENGAKPAKENGTKPAKENGTKPAKQNGTKPGEGSGSQAAVGNGGQKEIEVTSRLVSSLCALNSQYQEDKQMPTEPLKKMPQGIPLLDAKCDTWARSCGKGCDKWSMKKESKCKYEKQKGARIIGGEDAQLGDAPWDIHLRFFYDWGGTQGSEGQFTKEEIATNNVSRIKEQHRCTGIFYTKNFVLTTGWCGHRGIVFAKTRNRLIGWLARQRFLLMNWCVFESDVNPKQTCDITLHPEFVSFEDDPVMRSRSTVESSNPEIQYRDHDISIINFYVPYDFKKYAHTRAVLLAQPGMEFEGSAIFAGWGTTDDHYTHSSVGSAGQGGATQIKGQVTKLQKIELTIIPFEPKCKKLIKKYLDKGAGDFDPKYDYSQRYLCAEPDDGTKQGLCGGDIGGALVCDKDGKKYVCGLKNSWGATVDCLKDREQVEIFLKMSHYTPWVESVAGEQSESDLNP